LLVIFEAEQRAQLIEVFVVHRKFYYFK
jgi:hypothetical protein